MERKKWQDGQRKVSNILKNLKDSIINLIIESMGNPYRNKETGEYTTKYGTSFSKAMSSKIQSRLDSILRSGVKPNALSLFTQKTKEMKKKLRKAGVKVKIQSDLNKLVK